MKFKDNNAWKSHKWLFQVILPYWCKHQTNQTARDIVSQQIKVLQIISRSMIHMCIQLYLSITPPDIPPNSLIATNLLLYKAFNSPVVPSHIFYVQTRLLNKEKWIEFPHQRSTSQWRSRSRHNLLVDDDTRPSTKQRWQSCRYKNSSVFICKIHT